MKKTWKRLCTGFLALATVVTALPTTPVHAESKQYWTESAERVGIIEKVMNDGSIGSTFNEGYMKVEGETAYCIDINTDFKNGYKTRADASSRMSADQISDVALSLEYVKQYGEAHKELNYKQVYLLEQCVVWQRLSVHLGWQCDNVRASYDEIPKATQDEVFAGARTFVKENKGRYECGGYIYSGEGQELGQFWAKLNVGNAKLQKTSSNTSITDGNGNYSIAGATYGVFADKNCTKQLATLTTDENGNTDVAEVKAGTVYIKELSAPAGYKVDKTIYPLTIKAGETATLKVSDTPKVTDTLIELFKIDMETQKDNPQGNASLAGAEFTWKYYAGFYNKDNLPAEATRTWVTKTVAETESNGTTHYITKLVNAYKVSGDSFYMQDGKAVLPLGTLTVEETKAPNGYLLEGAYMQTGDKSEQIKGLYLTQITEDGDLAVLSGNNQFSVSDKVIRGGVKIQKRDLETGDTKPQGSATLKDTAFDIISLNDNAVLVEGKLSIVGTRIVRECIKQGNDYIDPFGEGDVEKYIVDNKSMIGDKKTRIILSSGTYPGLSEALFKYVAEIHKGAEVSIKEYFYGNSYFSHGATQDVISSMINNKSKSMSFFYKDEIIPCKMRIGESICIDEKVGTMYLYPIISKDFRRVCKETGVKEGCFFNTFSDLSSMASFFEIGSKIYHSNSMDTFGYTEQLEKMYRNKSTENEKTIFWFGIELVNGNDVEKKLMSFEYACNWNSLSGYVCALVAEWCLNDEISKGKAYNLDEIEGIQKFIESLPGEIKQNIVKL